MTKGLRRLTPASSDLLRILITSNSGMPAVVMLLFTSNQIPKTKMCLKFTVSCVLLIRNYWEKKKKKEKGEVSGMLHTAESFFCVQINRIYL